MTTKITPAAFPSVTARKVAGESRVTFTIAAILTHAPGLSYSAAFTDNTSKES